MSKPENKKRRGVTALRIMALLSAVLIVRLGYLQIIKGDEYAAKAENQQLSDKETTPGRGSIYDANMNVLAQSASVWLVYINPYEINKISDETEREKVREIVVSGLSVILDMDADTIREYTQRDSSYQKVKGEIENDQREEILNLIDKYENEKDPVDLGTIIGINPDVKRYYPYSSLASTVIGFTGTDGVGLAGLEYYYDELLTGESGRTITAIDGNMSQMPNQYETIYAAKEGASLVLTLDIYIQYILEDVLSEAMETTKAENIYGIVMDVDTGAILGMVSLPDYDLNNPYVIKSETLQKEYEEQLTANYEDATGDEPTEPKSKSYYQNLQWRNRAVSNTYEPGSVFKIITASAALEEGTANLNTSYYCSGSIDYATRTIHCWKLEGHGSETFVDLLKNSCNPFAVTLAGELGTDRYYDYFEAFGFTEKTGLDLPGETTPREGVLYMSRDNFSQSDLASYSFGQSFQVSPIQMITAVAAVANGGKLMTPYIVDKVIDADGKTVSETEPTVKRQVISEKTASIVRDAMEQVVSTGTGKNAYVAGYHVAGKTGTSEKLTEEEEDVYIASFCGFAPAYDPEIAVIIIVDEPEGEHGGGAVAAPLAGEVFEQALEYLGVEHSYTDSELELLVETAPALTGKTVSEARSEVSSKSINVKVVGDGDTVISQYPEAGREIPSDGIIVLYTDEENTSKEVTVPDFTGYTVSEANRIATEYGLNIKISGSSLNSGTVYAYKQSIDRGETVSMGEIITVYFKTTVDVSD